MTIIFRQTGPVEQRGNVSGFWFNVETLPLHHSRKIWKRKSVDSALTDEKQTKQPTNKQTKIKNKNNWEEPGLTVPLGKTIPVWTTEFIATQR